MENSFKIGLKKINKDKLIDGLKNLKDNSYLEEFFNIKKKTLNVFALRDKIFDVSLSKLKNSLGSDFDYIIIDSASHAFPFLEPHKTSEIIYNYIKDKPL